MNDPRAAVARFYDLDREPLADLPFYVSRIPSANARVLELGCGTGLIIAPYRVMQNLETDDEVAGLFRCVRMALESNGQRPCVPRWRLTGVGQELLLLSLPLEVEMRSNRTPLLSLLLLAPAAATCGRPADTTAEERVLRDLDQKWIQATLAKDTIAIGDVYAEDAEFLPPNSPVVRGRTPIRTAWGQLLQPMSNLALAVTPSRWVVSGSGDLAYDVVAYKLSYDLPGGKHYDDVGKGVAVWKKVNGEWKVALDIFNSDKPAAR